MVDSFHQWVGDSTSYATVDRQNNTYENLYHTLVELDRTYNWQPEQELQNHIQILGGRYQGLRRSYRIDNEEQMHYYGHLPIHELDRQMLELRIRSGDVPEGTTPEQYYYTDPDSVIPDPTLHYGGRIGDNIDLRDIV